MEPRPLQFIIDATGGELLGGSPAILVSRICTDSRLAGSGDLFFALAGERFDAHSFLPEVAKRGVAAVVAERGKLPGDFNACPVIVVEDTRRALGRLGAAYRRQFDLPIAVVAGSNGKTTTKELIASVLRGQFPALWSESSFNNDVGVPLTLLRLDKTHRAAVLEAGSNHPGELPPLLEMIAPRLGVITNIGREHLEFFHDLDGVAREEGSVADALPTDGVLFINGDDPYADRLAARARCRVVRAGFGPRNDCRAQNIRLDDAGSTFAVRSCYPAYDGDYRIGLLGRHQILNALFAYAVGAELHLERPAVEHGLAGCAPANMRLQMLHPGGVRLLADAYNANADSMLAALDTLRELPCSGRRVAVLGDMAELGERSVDAHREVGRRVAEARLDWLFAVGARARDIADAARGQGMAGVVEIAEVESAARAVREFARPGDVVLVKASRLMRLERIVDAFNSAPAARS